jgi:hypothetical protein
MKIQYHILNGDALKAQLPKSINGDIIVARECLVDGPVEGDTFEVLYETRAQFLATAYGGEEEINYYDKAVTEFESIQKIPQNAEINLWFEDDLFCQVNLWFVLHLIKENDKKYNLYLIRPKQGSEYGFGSMNESDLLTAFQNKTKISPALFQDLSKLWRLYQQDDFDQLIQTADKLKDDFTFLLPAINAHIERVEKDGKPGRPTESLIRIIEELETDEFSPVFRAFCKKEGIYGFGDLQVKRLFDAVLKNR